MKVRLILTVLIIAAWIIVAQIYGASQGTIEGAAAVHQLNGGDAEYVAARAVALGGLSPIVNILFFALLLLIWLTAIFRKRPSNNTMAAIALLVGSMTLVNCGPPKLEHIEEIKPNETAYVIQLEGDSATNQDIFKSEEFLDKNKIAAKRVVIPQRKRSTGRMPGSFEWIDTAMLIKVDRTPITREWTKTETTGTSNKDEAIHVESKDSIGFGVGVTVTASIPESWSSKFLYYYAGRPLSSVLDENVRGLVGSILAREFGDLNLSEGREKKKEIFKLAYEETKTEFAKRGVSIDILGSSEGLAYDNPQIQASIDDVFRQQRDVEKAEQEKLAQDKRNQRIIAQATAEREAAQEFAKAQEASIARTRLEIEKTRVEVDKIRAQAELTAAGKWNGAPPGGVVPANSQFLFSFKDSGVTPPKQ